MNLQRLFARVREVAYYAKYPAGAHVWAPFKGKLAHCTVSQIPVAPGDSYLVRLVQGKGLNIPWRVSEEQLKPFIHQGASVETAAKQKVDMGKIVELLKAYAKENMRPESGADIKAYRCYEVAYIANLLFGGEIFKAATQHDSHVFVKIGGLYYDASSSNGVDDWKKLKYLKRGTMEDPKFRKLSRNALGFKKFFKKYPWTRKYNDL